MQALFRPSRSLERVCAANHASLAHVTECCGRVKPRAKRTFGAEPRAGVSRARRAGLMRPQHSVTSNGSALPSGSWFSARSVGHERGSASAPQRGTRGRLASSRAGQLFGRCPKLRRRQAPLTRPLQNAIAPPLAGRCGRRRVRARPRRSRLRRARARKMRGSQRVADQRSGLFNQMRGHLAR